LFTLIQEKQLQLSGLTKRERVYGCRTTADIGLHK